MPPHLVKAPAFLKAFKQLGVTEVLQVCPLTLTLSHSHPHFLSSSPAFSLTLSHPLTLSRSPHLSLSLTFYLSLALTHPLSPALSLCLTLCPLLEFTHPRAHSLTLPPSPARQVCSVGSLVYGHIPPHSIIFPDDYLALWNMATYATDDKSGELLPVLAWGLLRTGTRPTFNLLLLLLLLLLHRTPPDSFCFSTSSSSFSSSSGAFTRKVSCTMSVEYLSESVQCR